MAALKLTLSPRDLARAVGVSESSLKRWADDGLLQISRTAGGHRRIGLAEAASYIRRSGLPLADPTPLGLVDLSTLIDGVPTPQLDYLLVQAIRVGDCARACGLTLKLYLSGRSVCEICDGPMKHALRHDPVATQGSVESISVESEIEICIVALHQLRDLLPAGAERGVAVLPSDSLPLHRVLREMMKTVLTAECWQTIETTVDETAGTVSTHQAKLLAAPVDLSEPLLQPEVLDARQQSGCRLVLVGSAAATSPDIGMVESMSEFASLVRCVDAMGNGRLH